MKTPTKKPLYLLTCGILACLAQQAGAATTWSLANDFSLTSNPNGAWSYQMELDPSPDDTAYLLLSQNTVSANTIWGTTFANAPTMWTGTGGYWGIGRNDTGVTQTTAGLTWNPGEVLFHPRPDFDASGGRFVITWTAPVTMTIDVDWAYAKRMEAGLTGVGMDVLHESGGANTYLRSFQNPEGATGTFDDLVMLAGDSLHFRFDNWGDAGGDITWADITVTQIPEPGSLALFGLSALGLLSRRRRR